MSSTLGTAIGPFLGIWMSLHVQYNLIFILCSAIALSCLVFGFLIQVANSTIGPEKTEVNHRTQLSWVTHFLEPKALPIAFIILITSTCYSGVLSFINFYAKNIGLSKAASFFFLMYAFAILLSRPFTGKLMDRKGENTIMYPAILILTSALLLLSQVYNAGMLLLCAGLLGLGFGNIQSVCQTIAIKSTRIERMGLATSTFFIFLDAGLGFGPFILGLALNYISYSQLYLYSGAITALSLIFYYLLHGRKAAIAPSI